MIAGRATGYTFIFRPFFVETATKFLDAVSAALAEARDALAECGAPESVLATGTELAQLVGALTEDGELAVAAWIAFARAQGQPLSPEQIARRFGTATAQLSAELGRLGDLTLPAGWSPSQGLSGDQAETLRKMLLAVAADPRLVVARIAAQLIRLRHARSLSVEAQWQLATQTREIYAPLANRLGIWNLKWELEDLAFRSLEPTEYHQVAQALAERRVARERYIEQVCALLKLELERAGIVARIYGRPKHIYSIWRKMRQKDVPIDQVFDVRAVRIVADSVADCYAALGIVHGLWSYIPQEFDDYIATPKDNQYRSIHTAVHGPDGKSLEIQIRTAEMHEFAELGVAAHWRYKEGGARDQDYERKIERARRLLDPASEPDGDADLIDSVRRGLFTDRIYVLTPRAEIIELSRGATPLDFAYHLHTELGHRCRGAKVNGRIVPLNQVLNNGEIVEIITGRIGGPSRDWLNPEEGFLASARSRAKVRAWFRQQDQIAAAAPAAAVDAVQPAPEPEAQTVTRRTVRARPKRSAVDIEGVGDLPTTMARCCAPVPPEPIAGYVTAGRGVTIHRANCASLVRMRQTKGERVLRVEWNLNAESLMPVKISVEAFDRRGLLRDVSDIMALERLSIDGVLSNTDPADRIATIVMRTAVHDTDQLARVLKRLKGVPNVLRAERASGA
jgi:GTP pyrophosphokinase